MAMWLIEVAMKYGAPILLVASPVLSYSDQIYSIHRTKSCAGFSLDIPLIMLVASILKIFYWFGKYYETALLVQAIVMIIVQVALLKVALDNRPQSPVEHTPFAGQSQPLSRPYDFWQWKAARPYWTFLAYFTLSLLLIHVLITPVSRSEQYISLIGIAGLAVEAFLPVPQIFANQRSRSCKGFRFSVVAAWLLGDAMKMGYFIYSGDSVPTAFRVCGTFQCCCDCYLGVQYWLYGDRPVSRTEKGPTTTTEGDEDSERWGMKETDTRLS